MLGEFNIQIIIVKLDLRIYWFSISPLFLFFMGFFYMQLSELENNLCKIGLSYIICQFVIGLQNLPIV